MSLNPGDVMRIADESAREQNLPVDVLGVIGEGERDYAEVLVELRDCANEPCRMSVGVSRRVPESVLRADISEKFRRLKRPA